MPSPVAKSCDAAGDDALRPGRIDFIVRDLSPVESVALVLTTLMPPDGVLDSWLIAVLNAYYPDTVSKGASGDSGQKAIRRFIELGLLRTSDQPGVLRMHRQERDNLLAFYERDQGGAALLENIMLLRESAFVAARRRVDGDSSWPLYFFSKLPAALAEWLGRGLPVGAALALPLLFPPRLIALIGQPRDYAGLVAAAQKAIADLPPGPEKNDAIAACQELEGHLFHVSRMFQAAFDCYASALELRKHLPDANSGKRRMERGRCFSFMRAATLGLGDFELALSLQQKALAVFEALLHTPPRCLSLQQLKREMGFILEDLADTFAAFNDATYLEEALAVSMRALVLRKKLWEANKSNRLFQRDYCAALGRVGESLKSLGKTNEARAHFEESLLFARALHEQDPRSDAYQQTVATALDRVGDVRLGMGELEAALAFYKEALEIRHIRAVYEREQPLFWHDCSHAHIKIGDVLTRLHRASDALLEYQKAEDISVRLPSIGKH